MFVNQPQNVVSCSVILFGGKWPLANLPPEPLLSAASSGWSLITNKLPEVHYGQLTGSHRRRPALDCLGLDRGQDG
jgi:hypothetical protein